MARTPKLTAPKFVQYLGPVLRALHQLDGSARPAEVRTKVAEELKVSEEEQDDLLESGLPRFDNEVAWARFYLVKAGLVDSSRRGVWSLTENGVKQINMTHEEAIKLFKSIHAEFRDNAKEETSQHEESLSAPQEVNQPVSYDYQRETLEVLQSLPPDGFERFCQRLLRESGFQEVNVTGRSGDGGIDGIGILQVNVLVSFKVLFQCKRYKGSVTPSQVRDFRGAMQGRADKGIIITTGTFTSDAKQEAIRDGVPPIELVDGKKLIEMIEELELGLKPVTIYQVDKDFFEGYRKN
jgi:restriction system protein